MRLMSGGIRPKARAPVDTPSSELGGEGVDIGSLGVKMVYSILMRGHLSRGKRPLPFLSSESSRPCPVGADWSTVGGTGFVGFPASLLHVCCTAFAALLHGLCSSAAWPAQLCCKGRAVELQEPCSICAVVPQRGLQSYHAVIQVEYWAFFEGWEKHCEGFRPSEGALFTPNRS